jgi:hypothetical protein
MSTLLTTDLLDVWTDPDTAMEAVGTNLGIFDERVSSPTKVLATDERLRNTLFHVLLSLVEGGALEMRPCGDGRHAFRWREDVLHEDTVQEEREEEVPPPFPTPDPAPAPTPDPTPAPTPDPIPVPPASADISGVAEISIPDAPASAPRPIAQAPLLVVPALSCLLAVLVYLWFDGAVASVILGALVLAGVVGLIRRVPFAGAFTLGLVVAGLLVRFS